MSKRILYDCDVCDATDCGEPAERWPWPIRYASGPYTPPREEHHHGCISCTPGQNDHVLQKVKWFGVRDGAVERLYIVDEWFDTEDVLDNPYLADAIHFVENDLLPSVE